MLGANRMRRKVAQAVEKAVGPGEVALESVYLHTYGSASSAITVGGLPVNIGTWILCLTDRRVLMFKGDNRDASKSRLIAEFPRDAVTVESSGRGGRISHLTVSSGAGSQRFSVPSIWRRNATQLVAELAG
jgi:hypothetical protein